MDKPTARHVASKWRPPGLEKRTSTILWTIRVVLCVLWLLGFTFRVAGGLIPPLLVAAVIVLLYNLLRGRGSIGLRH